MRTIMVAAMAIAGCSSKGTVGPSRSTSPGDSPRPMTADARPVGSPASPDDHAASAAVLYDAQNYVTPGELAYSTTRSMVIYPACTGGEGPGEHCALAGLDDASKSVNLDPLVGWSRSGMKDPDGRDRAIHDISAALDALATFRLDRHEWTGQAMDVPGFGRIDWEPAGQALVASADGRARKVAVEWGDRGGPVNVYSSPDAPVAVVQMRVNPSSGKTEGYIVVIELYVVPRP